MTINLTPSAIERVRTMLAKRGYGVGLYLGTKVSGCTGFAYVVDYADEVKDSDLVFDFDEIKVVVQKKHRAIKWYDVRLCKKRIVK